MTVVGSNHSEVGIGGCGMKADKADCFDYNPVVQALNFEKIPGRATQATSILGVIEP
jgi:hypothetical protein